MDFAIQFITYAVSKKDDINAKFSEKMSEASKSPLKAILQDKKEILGEGGINHIVSHVSRYLDRESLGRAKQTCKAANEGMCR